MTYLGDAAGELSMDRLRYHGLLPTHRPPAWVGQADSMKEYHMTEFVLDLSKPTGHFEVSVWHYADDSYSVDRDRGHGRATVYETDSKDKALGVAEYLEQNGRCTSDGKGLNGSLIENDGEPFTGGIVHWDCSEVDHSH